METRLLVTALAAGIGGAIVGGGITYFTVKKTFAERAQRDIDEVKEYYREKFDGKMVINNYENMPGPAEPEEADLPDSGLTEAQLEEAKNFVEQLKYINDQKAAERIEEIVEERELSIYDRTEVPPADVEEVEDIRLVGYDRNGLRADNKPYLISLDEFSNTEDAWSKISLTYYEDDDVLADENDKAILPGDIDRMVGEIHLEFFGLRSQDKNIVYVRNGQLSADFEITRNSGNFNEIVLNVPKGADKVGVRRMRAGDDE